MLEEKFSPADFEKLESVDETDPNGLDQHEAGAKFDQGKIRAGLVCGDFGLALLEVSKVGTFGAQKYSDHGWLDVPDGIRRYIDAGYRHLLKSNTEFADKDSNIDHIACAAWNLLAAIELRIREGLSARRDTQYELTSKTYYQMNSMQFGTEPAFNDEEEPIVRRTRKPIV